MYIKFNNANNKIVLTVVIIYVILIFPLFFNINAIFLSEQKKLYFSCNFFGFIKVISGYAEIKNFEIIIHISDSKAFILPIKTIFKKKISIKPFMDFHIIKFNGICKLKDSDDFLRKVMISFYLSIINGILDNLLKIKKPYLKYNNTFNVIENEKQTNLFINTGIVFNMITVVISMLKILMGKIYAKRKSKQNKYGF